MTRAVLKSAVAALALIGSSASVWAQDVTLTLHHFMSPKSPPHVKFLEPWAEKIAADSDGRIKVELFPSMSMGGKPPELYRQVRDGARVVQLEGEYLVVDRGVVVVARPRRREHKRHALGFAFGARSLALKSHRHSHHQKATKPMSHGRSCPVFAES